MASPRTVLVVMCVGYFLVLLDVTIVNVALPSIHASVDGLQWVVDGYALALASLMLAAGGIGDLYGHRRVALSGLVVFGAGSLACGVAPSVGALVAARVVQGVGAALLLPSSLAIISRAFAGEGQARAIGVWAGVGSLALPAGPLLGGVLLSLLNWRAVFLINVPIVLAALAFAWRVPESRGSARLDVPGLLLGMLFLFALTFAVIQRSVLAGVAAALALGAFVAAERREGAMLPLALFRRPAFTLANGTAGVMNLCTLGTLFLLTLFLQSVQGRSALGAGLILVPLFAPLAVLAPLAGRVVGRAGPRWPAVCGLLVAACGLALLATPAPLVVSFLLWGIGLGVLTPAVVAASIAAVAPERAGLASAINNTARQAGGAIGIALSGAIAGPPSRAAFVHGFHGVAVGSAAIYVLAAALSVRALSARA